MFMLLSGSFEHSETIARFAGEEPTSTVPFTRRRQPHTSIPGLRAVISKILHTLSPHVTSTTKDQALSPSLHRVSIQEYGRRTHPCLRFR
ncbi:hypothetical protein BT69DRAFT_1283377 [Atractiella rhizophila]|nr:hypothetical protein BT69DRAFT_1283377 [Atractiella rhizophila]